MWPYWVSQQGNDPKQMSEAVIKWLKDNKVKVMALPSQSINPIKEFVE